MIFYNENNKKQNNKLMIKQNYNLISQTYGLSCIHCGKIYKTRINLDKHLVLCETLIRAKKNKYKTNKEEELHVPSQKQMYKIILDLSLKCNHLEEKLEQMQKWVVKQKKKINILDWLREHIQQPNQPWSQFINSIEILKEDVEIILHNPFINILNQIFERLFQIQTQLVGQTENPIRAFTEKPNTFYIFKDQDQDQDQGWIECSKKDLIDFLNTIHFKIVKSFLELKKENQDKINESDSMSEIFNKANIKIMDISFKNEQSFNKARSLLYNVLKIDLKSVIEYEFEY